MHIDNPALSTTKYLSDDDFIRQTVESLPEGCDPTLRILGAGNRIWQIECFFSIRDLRFTYLSAFMGSGKSLVMQYLAAYELIRTGGTQKQVMLVPFNCLQKGFKSRKLAFTPDGLPARSTDTFNEWHWDLGERNLCIKNASAPKIIDALIQALIEPVAPYTEQWEERSFYGRIIVTTDLAMALAWERMTEEQRDIASGNHPDFGITYNKDEAHRVLMPTKDEDVEAEDDDDSTEERERSGNILGNIFARVLKSRRGNLRYATATFVRGDQRETILGNFEEHFEHYEQDFVEYYKTLEVSSFQMTSHVYPNQHGIPELLSFIRESAAKLSKEGKKWMLMLPHYNKGWRLEGLFNEESRWGVQLIFDILHEFYPEARVLDFVDPKKRAKVREILDREPEEGDSHLSEVDVAVGVDSLTMGVDWPSCSAIVNTVADNSIINLIQKPGRAFRRFPGKGTIDIYTCVPEFQLKSGMGMQDVMADFTNQILAHFFMKEMFEPIMFEGFDKKKQRLRDYWRKGGKYEKVCAAILDKWKELQFEAESEKRYLTVAEVKPKLLEIVKQYVDDKFPPTQLEAVTDAFIARLRDIKPDYTLPKARSASSGTHPDALLDATDISFMREQGFNKLVDDDRLNLFSTDHLNDEDLTQVSEMIRERYKWENLKWDSKFDRATGTFRLYPNIKPYLIERFENEDSIPWAKLGVSSDTEAVMRWAVGQQRLAVAGVLDGKQIAKMCVLFTPDKPQIVHTTKVGPYKKKGFFLPSYGTK